MSDETIPDIDAIEARCMAATPGPWFFHPDARPDVHTERVLGGTKFYATAWAPAATWLADAEFVAAVRADVPALIAHVRALREALERAYPVILRASDGDSGYGAFHGGDPRDFSPDPECSTEAERAAHTEACAAWDRGETPVLQDSTELAAIGCDGRRVDGRGYGLGTYTIYDQDARALVPDVARLLGRVRT